MKILKLKEMREFIIREGLLLREARKKKVLGREEVMNMPLETKSELPPQPWWTERRRMVCWAHPADPIVHAYNKRYRAFQRGFRESSDDYLEWREHRPFPDGCFLPGRYKPRPETQTAVPPPT